MWEWYNGKIAIYVYMYNISRPRIQHVRNFPSFFCYLQKEENKNQEEQVNNCIFLEFYLCKHTVLSLNLINVNHLVH